MNFLKNKNDTVLAKKRPLSDTNLLLVITIAVFAAIPLCGHIPWIRFQKATDFL